MQQFVLSLKELGIYFQTRLSYFIAYLKAAL